MNSCKLSPIIDISRYSDFNDINDFLYGHFSKNIMDRTKRNKLFNKFIFIDFSNWIDYKAEMYWHMISLSENERFNILPCNNDTSNIYCNDNCINRCHQVILSNGQKRNICIYRAIRIEWLNDIINLANNNDENIKIWEKDNKLYIRYEHETVDYAVVLEKQKNKYRLLSMFPVFYINKKVEFNTDYKKYKKMKNR